MVSTTGSVQRGWVPSGRCTVFACDIIAFGNARRVDHIQRYLRGELYERLGRGFTQAGVPYERCYTEDRGDGAIVVPPADISAATMISPLADLLDAEFRRQNEVANEVGRIRLRVALHAGEVHSDAHGISGTAVNHAFRLLEAPAFKRRVAETGARLALIVSQQLHDDIVRQGNGLIDPGHYERVAVESKETSTTGWARLLGVASAPAPPADPPAASQDGGTGGGPAGDDAPAASPASPESGVGEGRAGAGGEASWPVLDDRRPQRKEPAAPAAQDVDLSAGNFVAPGFRAAPGELLVLAEHLLDVPVMATERGRDQVIAALRSDIARMVSRQPESRMDAYCLLQTCLEHRGGIEELLDVLEGFAGAAESLRRFQQMAVRLLT